MCFFKRNKKEHQNYISTNSLTADMIKRAELDLICNKNIKGLLKASIKLDGSKNIKIKYAYFDLVSLKDFLKNSIDAEALSRIILDIYDTLSKISQYGLNFENINIDLDNIMLDREALKVYFVYLPVAENENIGLKSLLMNILISAKMKKSEDMEFKQSLLISIYGKENISIEDLQVLMQHIFEMDRDCEYIACPRCGAKNDKKMNFCVSCAAKLQNNMELLNDFENRRVCKKYNEYLTRKRNGERFMLDKQVMIIGKNVECDCIITENRAISNRHAQFIKYNGRFFINDLGSTNKTYVSGIEVRYGVRMEIHSGDTIRLANEDFIFTAE